MDAAPGDRLRARLIARRPGYGRGEIVEVLLPGPERRDAPCPHFADCGGCDLQQIGDEAQVERLNLHNMVVAKDEMAEAP